MNLKPFKRVYLFCMFTSLDLISTSESCYWKTIVAFKEYRRVQVTSVLSTFSRNQRIALSNALQMSKVYNRSWRVMWQITAPMYPNLPVFKFFKRHHRYHIYHRYQLSCPRLLKSMQRERGTPAVQPPSSLEIKLRWLPGRGTPWNAIRGLESWSLVISLVRSKPTRCFSGSELLCSSSDVSVYFLYLLSSQQPSLIRQYAWKGLPSM